MTGLEDMLKKIPEYSKLLVPFWGESKIFQDINTVICGSIRAASAALLANSIVNDAIYSSIIWGMLYATPTAFIIFDYNAINKK